MAFDRDRLNRQSRKIPEPRRNEPLDESAIRSQQDAGQPSVNLLVPDVDTPSLDSTNIEPERMGQDDSDVPLAQNPGVSVDEFFDGDMPIGVMV